MIVATAGHIDHGKTLLMKALTGIDTDRLPEEKKRGMSIDLGFAYSDFGEGLRLGFVDVPGHERFIGNMLAGVAGIDFAVLVVAADDGPMPQTLEHLAILDLLGVKRGAVALSKIDKVPEERVAEITGRIAAMLPMTGLAHAPVFPLSGLTGQGIDSLRLHLGDEARKTVTRNQSGNFRLAVDRSFSVKGTGLVVTGSAFSGQVTRGDRMILSPAGVEVQVRGLHAQNQSSETGVAGQRCALNLVGTDLDKTRISRGDWIVDARVHAPTNRMDANLRVSSGEADALKHWTSAHLYLGATDVTCRVATLQDKGIDPAAGGLVQLVLDHPIGAVRGDRFILRDQSARRTIAGGTVIDPFSPARGRARPERLAWLQAMALETPDEALDHLLRNNCEGLDLKQFARAWNLTDDETRILFEGVPLVKVEDRAMSHGFSTDHWSAYTTSVRMAVNDWHQKMPERLGPNDHELSKTIRTRVPNFVRLQAIRIGIGAGHLVRTGTIIHAPDHAPVPSPETQDLWRRVAPLLHTGGLRPPVARDLAAELKLDPGQVEAFLVQAVNFGWLIRVAANRFFVPEAIRTLAEIAEAVADDDGDGTITPRDFRDRSGIGRNVTIEVLEFFDKAGFTRRIKAGRRINLPAEDVFDLPQT